jgi:hypothetical protein
MKTAQAIDDGKMLMSDATISPAAVWPRAVTGWQTVHSRARERKGCTWPYRSI